MSGGLDIEGVLADVIADDPMWIGDDGQPLDYLPEREARIAEFVYSVAAVLREQIAAAQAEAWERGRADERRHAAAVRDYHHWSSISAGPPASPTNPYRAAQVVPSRVPGEET